MRPHVTVVVDLTTLTTSTKGGGAGVPAAAPAPSSADDFGAAGTVAAATLDRLGAISAATARMIACDASVTRVLTGPGSQPLDVGRASRVVTVAQRRALAVRDRGCVGCRAPVAWTEAHHIRHWVDHGPTDLANLVLLCSRCHRDVHHRTRTLVRDPSGRWILQSARPPP